MKEHKRAKRPAGNNSGPHSIYLGPVYIEIDEQARRLGRSKSWTVRSAWKIALPEIKKMAPQIKD